MATRIARSLLLSLSAGAFGVLVATSLPTTQATGATAEADAATAVKLAELLRSARTVISRNQALINNPEIGDKGLTGEKVLEDAIALYAQSMGEDPRAGEATDADGPLRAQMDAIVAVMDGNQGSINAEGIGFKGFIPAVFARLVNERFAEAVGERARIKVTAPERLVRNRKARPDDWETAVIEGSFLDPQWPKGQPLSETTTLDGRQAFRFVVPEYYVPSCLACHGEPAGEVDATGYPKEGGAVGDLGSVISITLFK